MRTRFVFRPGSDLEDVDPLKFPAVPFCDEREFAPSLRQGDNFDPQVEQSLLYSADLELGETAKRIFERPHAKASVPSELVKA
jgi:hypothetical protein